MEEDLAELGFEAADLVADGGLCDRRADRRARG
jgi:hypothetical protein